MPELAAAVFRPLPGAARDGGVEGRLRAAFAEPALDLVVRQAVLEQQHSSHLDREAVHVEGDAGSAGGGDDVMLIYGRWPTWAPQGKSVAYQGCNQSGNQCGLWVMDADGSNARPLTNVPGDAMPAWSPDGARLAFASADRGGGWDVYVLEVATGNIATLASSAAIDAHPVWSPDGKQVAILSNRSGAWAIYTVDVATGRTRHVLTLPGILPDWYEASLAWGR